jgi:hypothetical protein
MIPPVHRRQSLPAFRRLWTGTGQPQSDRQRGQRGHQPDQRARQSHEPHPLWSGRASSRSRLALRRLIVSLSHGDRRPQRKLFAVDVCTSSPARRSAASRSPIATSTPTAKASIRRSRSCRSGRCATWASKPARRTPTAYPSDTPSARPNPDTPPNCVLARSAVTLTVASLFHVPPPISDESNFDTPSASLVRTPTWLTARLTRFAFSGCDDEHP